MKGGGGFPISLLIMSLLSFQQLTTSMELLSPDIVQAISSFNKEISG
jgi:hypothetical protein